jgi:hypothetical protein
LFSVPVWLRITAKVLGWGIITLVTGLCLVLFLLRLPAVQKRVGQRLANYLSEKTATDVRLGNFEFSYQGKIRLVDVYVADKQGDTLLYSGNLQVGVSTAALLRNEIYLWPLQWDQLVLRIKRHADSSYNFSPWLIAFAATDTATSQHTEKPANSEPTNWKWRFSPIELHNLRLLYDDALTAARYQLHVQQFKLVVAQLSPTFEALTVDSLWLNGSWLSVTPPQVAETEAADSLETPLAPFALQLNFAQINGLNFAQAGNSLAVETLVLKQLALNTTQKSIALQSVRSHGFDYFQAYQAQVAAQKPAVDEVPIQPFRLPDWQYRLDTLELANYQLELVNKPNRVKIDAFDPKWIKLRLNSLQLQQLRGDASGLSWENFGFDAYEHAGIALTASMKASLQANMLQLQLNEISTQRSRLQADLLLQVNDLLNWKQPEALEKLQLEIDSSTRIDLQDALLFAPELEKDSSLQYWLQHPIQLAGTFTGNTDSLWVDQLHLSWARGSKLKANILAVAITDSLQRSVALKQLLLESRGEDLLPFYAHPPKKLAVSASGQWSKKVAELRLKSQIDQGNLGLQAKVGLDDENFDLHWQANNLAIGQLLGDTSFDQTSFHGEAKGRGFSPYNMALGGHWIIDQFKYRNYDYAGTKLTISADVGDWRLQLQQEQPDLEVDLLLLAKIDSLYPRFTLTADAKNINFYKLGLTPQPTQARFQLSAESAGLPDSLQARLDLKDALIVQQAVAYPLSKFQLIGYNLPNATALEVESPLLNGRFSANSGLEGLLKAVVYDLKKQWQALPPNDSLSAPIQAQAHFDIPKSDLLSQVLLPGITQLDSGQLAFTYKSGEKLDARFAFDQIEYEGVNIKNPFLKLESDSGLHLVAGFDRLKQSPVDIHLFRLQANLADSMLHASILVNDSNKQAVLLLSGDGNWTQNNRFLKISDELLVIDGKDWQVDPDNRIVFGKQPLVEAMTLQHGQQSLAVEVDSLQQALHFVNFPLSAIGRIVNAQQPLATGDVQGRFAFEKREEHAYLLADLVIDSLALLNQQLGRLQVDARATDAQDFVLDAGLRGEPIDLSVKGKYFPGKSGAAIDLDFQLQKLALEPLVYLTDSAVQAAKGQISASFTMTGAVKKPNYSGNLRFVGASLLPAASGVNYQLGENPLFIDQSGIRLTDWVVKDEKNNVLTLNGRVLTPENQPLQFDVQLKTKDFQFLNVTRERNDLFFGQLRLNADMTLTGTPDQAMLKAKARLNKGSKLTVIVPESEAALIEREGIVVFSRMDAVADTLIDLQETNTASPFGLTLRTELEVDPASEFVLVIDERSGDQLSLAGAAKLRYDLNPNGIANLSGVYEISKGAYSLNLYEVVKRKFELVPGGRIVWNGSPTDARLDLKALYRVKTSPADLMSSQLSSADDFTRTRYRQELPFEVYMNINGALLQPKINFSLDMPEQQRQALDGNVYARVQQLNQQESDLNKQVFSLMVLNRFVPVVGNQNAASGGSAAALARSSVSQLLSSQANQLSAQYLKGVDLNLNLDSYTDYSSGAARDRTQLNVNVRKNFYGDRLQVELGRQLDLQGNAQATQDLVGDVSIQYKLNETGNLRLRAFRRNQLEGLAEGPLVVTGMALVLSREFNGFDELLKKQQNEANEEEEKP